MNTCISISERSFNEVSSAWLDEIQRTRKQSTYDKYCNIINNYFAPLLSGRNISCLNDISIDELLDEKWCDHDSNPSLSIVRSIRSVYCRIAAFGQIELSSQALKSSYDSEKFIEYNSFNSGVTVFTSTQQRRLIKYLMKEPNSIKTAILVCLYTGIRIGEICALKTTDISLSEKKIYIRHTVQRLKSTSNDGSTKTVLVESLPKTPSSVREVPICSFLHSFLKDKMPDSEYFLDDRGPTEPRKVQYRFKQYQKAANISVKNFHVLRHTFATNCISYGMDAKTLSLILGHSDVRTTLNRYVHPSIDLKVKQLNKCVKNFPVSNVSDI